jgi:chemotaxis protein methyltransferase CheR
MTGANEADCLYGGIEKLWGIKTAGEALEKLGDYLRQSYGNLSFEDPRNFEKILDTDNNVAKLVTVNETYFFREEDHFTLLLDEILPALSKSPGIPLRICSAASSIGCEAYSIAMILEEYNKSRLQPVQYHIDAFDINGEVIEIAGRGEYNRNSIREDGSRFKYILDNYLHQDGEKFKIDESLGEKINFYRYNIMDGLPESHYDLIFFRNAFIYFSPGSRARILSNLAAALSDRAFLVMGVSEMAGANHPLLLNNVWKDTFYFRKALAGAG